MSDKWTNALPIASPNLNGRVERIIPSIKRECLGKFILLGRLVKAFERRAA